MLRGGCAKAARRSSYSYDVHMLKTVASNRKRYSELGPLPIEEKIRLAALAVKFFSPLSYKEMCEAIGITPDPTTIRPLSGHDFLKFLKISNELGDPDKHLWQIRDLLRALCAANILADMGPGKDFMIGHQYYFLREMTTIERQGWLWLAPALGPEFLYQVYSSATCQLTGISDGGARAGTALIIAPRWLLTCAHVLTDMSVDERQKFRGVEFSVSATYAHESIDVGFVQTSIDLPITRGLSFRSPRVGDFVCTVGYPRIPLSVEPSLILHRGEVTNARVEVFSGETLFTYSAIARPGNSGGPIVGEHGSVVGIVSRALAEDASGAGTPFYSGVGTSEIESAARELVPQVELPIETYE